MVATKTGAVADQSMDEALVGLLHQLPESMEATDIWREIIAWAEGVFQETGRPATLDDLYRDLPNLRVAELLDDLEDTAAQSL